jgi:hypothetical protein
MEALVITPKGKSDLGFLRTLLEKLDYSVEELTEEDIEDLALLKAMVTEKKGEYVAEEDIKKALK